MAYPQVRYLNFPQIPDSLIEETLNQLPNSRTAGRIFHTYSWTSIDKTRIEDWCNQNISSGLIWGLQIIKGDLTLHVDSPTKVKISYIFETGGDNVFTEFYKDHQSNILVDRIKIDPLRWHILNVNVPHKVVGMDAGRVRVSLTGKIF